MLENTHKNTDVYKLFSERMKEMGYERSVKQCRAKGKKLRQLSIIRMTDQSQNSLQARGAGGVPTGQIVTSYQLSARCPTGQLVASYS